MTPWAPFVLLVAAGLAGCAAHRPEATEAERGSFAWKASLSLTIQAPRWGLAATVPAALVLRRPDALFLQVRGPLGGPVAEACTDRAGASVLLPGKRRLLVEADPEAAIRTATGGALGLDGVLALLLGLAPAGDGAADGGVPLSDGRVAALTRDTRGRLATLAVRDTAGADLLEAAWEGWARAEGAWRPGVLDLRLPPLDLRVRARFVSWETLGSLPVTCAHALPGGGPDGFAREGLREALEAGRTGPPEVP